MLNLIDRLPSAGSFAVREALKSSHVQTKRPGDPPPRPRRPCLAVNAVVVLVAAEMDVVWLGCCQ
jgi:hypothetical protein